MGPLCETACLLWGTLIKEGLGRMMAGHLRCEEMVCTDIRLSDVSAHHLFEKKRREKNEHVGSSLLDHGLKMGP